MASNTSPAHFTIKLDIRFYKPEEQALTFIEKVLERWVTLIFLNLSIAEKNETFLSHTWHHFNGQKDCAETNPSLIDATIFFWTFYLYFDSLFLGTNSTTFQFQSSLSKQDLFSRQCNKRGGQISLLWIENLPKSWFCTHSHFSDRDTRGQKLYGLHFVVRLVRPPSE